MAWTVIVAKSAAGSLETFPAKDRARIATALQAMAQDPFIGDTAKLQGERNRWRRRVGNYRIFFSVEQKGKLVSVSAMIAS